MADESAASEPRACPPCRGGGQVISGKGGEPHTMPCPWCEGSGRFTPDHDAQAARRAAAEAQSTAG